MTPDSMTFDVNIPWYLVHCQARKELYAVRMLREMFGIFAYCPQGREYIHGAVQNFPFFPGYIFIQADLCRVSPRQINTCPGVLRLVEFDSDPQPVPVALIEEIYTWLECMEVGKRQTFRPGDVVHIRQHAAFKDLEVIFVGPTPSSQRVYVLLSILGRLTKVSVNIEAIEKVAAFSNQETEMSGPARRRERYTRGKGRKIRRYA